MLSIPKGKVRMRWVWSRLCN